MFSVRLVISRGAHDVTRPEANAAVGFPFCGSPPFFMLSAAFPPAAAAAVCFQEYFFLASKYQITCPGSYSCTFHFFRGAILTPPCHFQPHPPKSKVNKGSYFLGGGGAQKRQRGPWRGLRAPALNHFRIESSAHEVY
jgi:hypothetical protein